MKNNKLGFGCMRLPLKKADDSSSIDMPAFKSMVDSFIEEGFTYFDTAYPYHARTSETAIREAVVKRYKRDEFTLATKMPMWELQTKEDHERIFNEQLTKCGVDYFDYYLLHSLNAEHYKIAQDLNSIEFIREKKSQGKIKKLGFSFHDNAALLDEILTAHPGFDFVQLQLNYLDWESESIQSRKCYETARKHDMPIVVMEPVKGGTLASLPDDAQKLLKGYAPDMSIASWAIRFAASRPGVMMVLSGMSNMQQLNDNMDIMKNFQPLSKEEESIIEQVIGIISDAITVPCTACGYCTDACPQNIMIPKYFELFNSYKQFYKGGFALQKVYYENLTKTHGKASECISCSKCEENCPQNIEIAKWMPQVAEALEE